VYLSIKYYQGCLEGRKLDDGQRSHEGGVKIKKFGLTSFAIKTAAIEMCLYFLGPWLLLSNFVL